MANETIIGIALDSGGAEWARLACVRGQWTREDGGRVTPPAALASEDGQAPAAADPAAPRDRRAEMDRLLAAVADQAGRKPARVALALPTADTLLRVLALPAVADGEERDGMVRLQMDKASPFAAENQVVGHEVAATAEDQQWTPAVVAREEDAAALWRAAEARGWQPERLDSQALGHWHGLATRAGMTEGRALAIVWSPTEAAMIIADDGRPALFRTLPHSEMPATPDAAATRLDELAGEAAHAVMTAELEWGARPLTFVGLAAAGAENAPPAELADSLQHHLGVATHVWREPVSAAEGVARRLLEPGPRLDLTPPALRARESLRLVRRRLALAATLLLVVWAAGLGGFFAALTRERLVLARLDREAVALQPAALDVRAKRALVGTIGRYLDQGESALECLREVSEILPPGIELTQLAFRRGENAVVSGEAEAVNQVYEFKQNVDDSPLFKGGRASTLTGPQWDERKRKNVFELDIGLPARGVPGGAAARGPEGAP